jgi:hypothetical protein
MSAGLVKFLERGGLRLDWHCRHTFLLWLFTPIIVATLVVVVLLTLNPQRSKYIYIFQSMVTDRSGPHPWDALGPSPPQHYTGFWRRWHWNGRASFEEYYKEGKLDGRLTMWDKAGHKEFEGDYRGGGYHGAYIWFYHNGTTCRLEHFSDGKPIGRWLHFHEDGTKWEERSFSAPGVPDGDAIVWNTNGAITFKHTWRKGEPWDGRFTLYRGTNWFQAVYESGRLIASTNLGSANPWSHMLYRETRPVGPDVSH